LHLTTSELVEQLKEEMKPMATDEENPLMIALRSYLATIEPKIPDTATRRSVATVQRILEDLEDGANDEEIAARDIAAVVAVLS
jgi:hypothetical protein